ADRHGGGPAVELRTGLRGRAGDPAAACVRAYAGDGRLGGVAAAVDTAVAAAGPGGGCGFGDRGGALGGAAGGGGADRDCLSGAGCDRGRGGVRRAGGGGAGGGTA